MINNSKRAGLDYHEWARVHHHQNYEKFLADTKSRRVFACSTHGNRLYSEVALFPR